MSRFDGFIKFTRSNFVLFNSIDSIGSENFIYNKPYDDTFGKNPVNGSITFTFSAVICFFSFFSYFSYYSYNY